MAIATGSNTIPKVVRPANVIMMPLAKFCMKSNSAEQRLIMNRKSEIMGMLTPTNTARRLLLFEVPKLIHQMVNVTKKVMTELFIINVDQDSVHCMNKMMSAVRQREAAIDMNAA